MSALPLFFFNDTATTEIYTLSLHDALPIFARIRLEQQILEISDREQARIGQDIHDGLDRKSTRLNSSHPSISYAVFCLKKKKNSRHTPQKCSNTSYTNSTTSLSSLLTHEPT